MSRETRLALARPRVRRGLWWSWLGGGLAFSAIFEGPAAVARAIGVSGPGIPAALGWMALAAGVLAYRAEAGPRTAALAAIGPLAVSGVAPTPVVIASALALSGLAGGWVVGAVTGNAQREPAAGAAAGGLSLLAAAGGIVLVPLSSLWLVAVAALVLATGSIRPPSKRDGSAAPAPATTGDGVLQASDLSVSFGDRLVLGRLSITIRPGELVALVGANGSGKSTLLRVLSGHLLPDEGRMWLSGGNVLGSSPEGLARLGVTLASGSRPVFPDLTVRENLQIATWITEGTRRSRAELASAALARFPELSPLSRAPAGTLSGGEQRLLALSASLVARPRVLLADEVTLGLSPRARISALRTLRRSADSGAAVLVVEHEIRDVLPLADRVLILEDGRLRETTEPMDSTARFIPEVDT